MSLAKHIEITSESKTSFDDAIAGGLDRASETVKGIRSAWIKDQQVLVESGKITAYRVNMKVTFMVGS